MWCIIVSIGCEYFFLIVNVYYIIRSLIESRKKTKTQDKKETIEDLMMYKWVRNADTLKRKENKVKKEEKVKISAVPSQNRQKGVRVGSLSRRRNKIPT